MSSEPVAALLAQSQDALRQGQPDRALALLGQADALDKADPEIPLNRALALRIKGDLASAMAALDAALARDPYSLMALLSKGAVLEQMGRIKLAAQTYRAALQAAPPGLARPPHLAAPLARAEQAVSQNNAQLEAFIHARTQEARAAQGAENLGRFDECVAILAGTKKAFVHEPALVNFPKLPAFTFYDRSYFPWLATLEAATPAIQEEAVALINGDLPGFEPYIQRPPNEPLNQWKALNNSPDWSSLHFWRDGKRYDENCARCPRTVALLEQLPLARQDGFGPTAMLSVLKPHTTIPAHTGSANTRLITHLALIVPENCRYRVGNDFRQWREGEAFVFDDTIEHEAWNDSDKIRVVLIFDVWNPLLSDAERAMVTAMGKALQAYYAEE